MTKLYYIYILSNDFIKNPTLYIGVTNNLIRRVYEHKESLLEGFTKKYNLKKLIHFKQYNSIEDALNREKQLKHWNREWKLNLVKKANPTLRDLYPDLL